VGIGSGLIFLHYRCGQAPVTVALPSTTELFLIRGFHAWCSGRVFFPIFPSGSDLHDDSLSPFSLLLCLLIAPSAELSVGYSQAVHSLQNRARYHGIVCPSFSRFFWSRALVGWCVFIGFTDSPVFQHDGSPEWTRFWCCCVGTETCAAGSWPSRLFSFAFYV